MLFGVHAYDEEGRGHVLRFRMSRIRGVSRIGPSSKVRETSLLNSSGGREASTT